MSKYLNLCSFHNKKIEHDNILDVRRDKLLELRKNNFIFPNNFRRNFISDQLHEKYDNNTNQELIKKNIEVKVAGRIIARRVMGKVSFITLRDSGGSIQIYISSGNFQEYQKNIEQWDIGDILGVFGTLFKTRSEELSIFCKEIQLLTKSLRPLPNKFHGLVDKETKYRSRYLDLIVNEETRETFRIRSFIIFEIRKFMVKNNFMEVETPMLHMIPGGAVARPFITYHNKLRTNMYLRVAPELYLKKLVVGGFEKIFEINRNFRNEGMSTHHNPEFTMMEIYIAYADYDDMIILIQDLFRMLTKKILGQNVIHYGSYLLDFDKPFIKMTIKEAIINYISEIHLNNVDNLSIIIAVARSLGLEVDENWRLSRLHMELFEKIVIKKIIQPTCVTDYPIEVSPLARRNNNNPIIADRFEFFIAGQEIGNGFSELNDPEDQRERFLQQVREKNFSNEKNNFSFMKNYDEDYLIALEHGLPPTAGIGIGIDRLVMLLTNKHTIRDVILFPTLRSKNKLI